MNMNVIANAGGYKVTRDMNANIAVYYKDQFVDTNFSCAYDAIKAYPLLDDARVELFRQWEVAMGGN